MSESVCAAVLAVTVLSALTRSHVTALGFVSVKTFLPVVVPPRNPSAVAGFAKSERLFAAANPPRFVSAVDRLRTSFRLFTASNGVPVFTWSVPFPPVVVINPLLVRFDSVVMFCEVFTVIVPAVFVSPVENI